MFVEELTKSVVEAREQVTGDGAQGRKATDTLAIPATLQETLLARLDRLSTARQIAQLGATLGREFSYELLHAVAPVSETDLQTDLTKLVEAEILYQRGVGQQTRYFFKHALIQDTAYQSLLKSTRQRYHQQIAQTLEERFSETQEAQPELLAHHYTEAGLIAQAIPYWQRAGERAAALRSANSEAIRHLSKGLELLKTLPETLERDRQEVTLQIALGASLFAAKSYSAPDVEHAYVRAQELCRRLGETEQLIPVLMGIRTFYLIHKDIQRAYEISKQILNIAQRTQNRDLLLAAYIPVGEAALFYGELALAHSYLEQGFALCGSEQVRPSWMWLDFRVMYPVELALVLWHLGYPDQARERSQEALRQARTLAHPISMAYALYWSGLVQQRCHQGAEVQRKAEETMTLTNEHGFTSRLAWATVLYGWALAERGQREAAIEQMRQGLRVQKTSGTELYRAFGLACLAETYGAIGQPEEGLVILDEAFVSITRTQEQWDEAELYRLKGELTLQLKINNEESRVSIARPTEEEAEGYFLKAIDISRKQQAKSLELRAVMSLVRLRQQQAQDHATRNTRHEVQSALHEARSMLSDVYHWFTEGFDTKDLQEAKGLLEELGNDNRA